MSVYVVQEDKRTADRKINDTIKLAMLSVEPLRFVGESPQTNVHFETCSRTTETCSRILELVKEPWNLLKNFGTY